jgi:hypothetical protein
LEKSTFWQLERIAAHALAKAPKCVTGRRVDLERLMQEGFDIQRVAFHELTRRRPPGDS